MSLIMANCIDSYILVYHIQLTFFLIFNIIISFKIYAHVYFSTCNIKHLNNELLFILGLFIKSQL